MKMMTDSIDETRFNELIAEAQRSDDCSSAELGEMVSELCKRVLVRDNFVGYSEDWQMEMFGEATLAVFKAISRTTRTDAGTTFNYLYTVVVNSFKKSILRLKRLPLPMEIDENCGQVTDPFYMRNRRRIVRGILDRNEDEIISAAQTRKEPLLRNVIGRAARAFELTLKPKQIDELLQIARKNREALC